MFLGSINNEEKNDDKISALAQSHIFVPSILATGHLYSIVAPDNL